MWIVRLALRRPYTIAVLCALMTLAGALSSSSMLVDVFPVIDIPVVAVVWNYPGLPAEDMERRVVFISERGISTSVAGVARIESQSIPGLGLLKVYFQPGADIGAAIAQIASVSATAQRIMPPGITPPVIVQWSAGNVPVAQLTASSRTLSEEKVFDYGLNFVRIKLFTIPGLSTPAPFGGKHLREDAAHAAHVAAVGVEQAFDAALRAQRIERARFARRPRRRHAGRGRGVDQAAAVGFERAHAQHRHAGRAPAADLHRVAGLQQLHRVGRQVRRERDLGAVGQQQAIGLAAGVEQEALHAAGDDRACLGRGGRGARGQRSAGRRGRQLGEGRAACEQDGGGDEGGADCHGRLLAGGCLQDISRNVPAPKSFEINDLRALPRRHPDDPGTADVRFPDTASFETVLRQLAIEQLAVDAEPARRLGPVALRLRERMRDQQPSQPFGGGRQVGHT